MTLDKLDIGKDAVISAVNCDSISLRKHILDMGLTPGTEVTLVKTAPMGDPLELRVRGYELTLRMADAAMIAAGELRAPGRGRAHLRHAPHGQDKGGRR